MPKGRRYEVRMVQKRKKLKQPSSKDRIWVFFFTIIATGVFMYCLYAVLLLIGWLGGLVLD